MNLKDDTMKLKNLPRNNIVLMLSLLALITRFPFFRVRDSLVRDLLLGVLSAVLLAITDLEHGHIFSSGSQAIIFPGQRVPQFFDYIY